MALSDLEDFTIGADATNAVRLATRLQAVEQALEYSSYSHDAVKHLLLSRTTPVQKSFPLNPDLIPGITDRWIADSDLNRYDALLTGGAL